MDPTKRRSGDIAKITLRLPAGLLTSLSATAKREGRSMNSQAVQILKTGLERKERTAA